MSEDRPMFSVILPTYNGEEFVSDALDSIEGQRYTDFEVIVSDDASMDTTRSVIEKHTLEPEVFLKHDENRGIARNTNQAVAHATGKYLAFLDQDDSWMPEKLRKHANAHEKNDISMVYSDYRLKSFEQEGFQVWRCPDASPSGKPLLKQLLDEHNFVRTLSGVTICRDIWQLLGGFDDTFRLAADYDLWFRLAEKHNFEHLSEILVEKRAHDQNVSSNRDLNYTEILSILHKLSLRHQDIVAHIKQKRRKTHFTRAWETYLEGESQTAIICCWRSLREHTSVVHDDVGTKPYGLLLLSLLDLMSGSLNVGRQLLSIKRTFS